jgi:S1-C subfamily serine protease
MPRVFAAYGGYAIFCFCLLSWIPAGLAQNPEVVELTRKAEQGDAEAQYNLAVIYDLGIGVTKSYAESGKWYLKAANQGLAEAQFQLGVRYFEFGKSARENFTTAFTWFFKAANQGVAEAQYNVGVMYQLGRGVPQNKAEAYKWFNIAGAQGYTKAIFARETLGAELKPDELVEGDRRAAAFTPKRGFHALASNPAGPNATPKSSGTGFFVTDDGFLVTNHHVVEENGNYLVKTKSGSYPAKIIKTDPTNDIALLKVTGSFKALPLAHGKECRLGEGVFTIGFPNPELQGLEPKLTRGELSSLAGMKDDARYFQISVPVQPGNSGGPLVDSRGNVVGLVSMRMGDFRALKLTGAIPQNVNYALKSSLVLSLLESVPEAARGLKTARQPGEANFEENVVSVQDGVAIILGF